MRTPVFELHIRPLFRLLDREKMGFAFDLWDYDSVVGHLPQILSRLGTSRDMPPASHGGPWPDEWIALLTRWRDTGMKRLELGTANYQFQAGSSSARITATGVYPAAGYNGWLQLETLSSTERQWVLYWEPPDSAVEGEPLPFQFRESYKLPETREVSIRDAAGVHSFSPAPVNT